MLTAITILLTALGVALLVETWRSHRQLREAIAFRDETPELDEYPSVTVIRPIKGLDAGVRENMAAALAADYPGERETIFVFDDRDEPAVPLAREVIREHDDSGAPGEARIVYCGAPPPGRTGKLNAMIVAFHEARGELVAFADSDLREDDENLKALVRTLVNDPAAGSAFTPVVVSEATRTAGDAGYALLLNGLYGPSAAWAAKRSEDTLPFIMGQYMLFKREALTAIGGLETGEGQLVDDMYIGMRIDAAGYKNKVVQRQVKIVQGGLPFKEFWSTFLRWITFSRSGLPGSDFKLISWLRGTSYWLGFVLAAIAAWSGAWAAMIAGLLVPVFVSWSIARLHEDLGGARLSFKHAAVSFLIFLVAPVIYGSIFLKREVSWRGRSYKLGTDSRLSDGRALAADEGLAATHSHQGPTAQAA